MDDSTWNVRWRFQMGWSSQLTSANTRRPADTCECPEYVEFGKVAQIAEIRNHDKALVPPNYGDQASIGPKGRRSDKDQIWRETMRPCSGSLAA
jgi:hypothetical protein